MAIPAPMVPPPTTPTVAAGAPGAPARTATAALGSGDRAERPRLRPVAERGEAAALGGERLVGVEDIGVAERGDRLGRRDLAAGAGKDAVGGRIEGRVGDAGWAAGGERRRQLAPGRLVGEGDGGAAKVALGDRVDEADGARLRRPVTGLPSATSASASAGATRRAEPHDAAAAGDRPERHRGRPRRASGAAIR